MASWWQRILAIDNFFATGLGRSSCKHVTNITVVIIMIIITIFKLLKLHLTKGNYNDDDDDNVHND